MTTRSQYKTQKLTFYEDTAFETVQAMAPVLFEEDFIGGGHTAGFPAAGSPVAGYPWIKKIVGAAPPTAALVANAAGGQVALALAATSEKEEASIYWNDNLALDVTKQLNIEFRAALTVPPSATGVEAVFGVAQAWIDGPDNNARYVEFAFLANNTLVVRSKDGINSYSMVADYIPTPVISIPIDTNFHIYGIDMSNLADIAFTLDGVRVNLQGSVNWSAVAANSLMQPYMSVYKPSGTGVATLVVDKVDCWSNRV